MPEKNCETFWNTKWFRYVKKECKYFLCVFLINFFLRPIKCSSLPAIKRLPFSKNNTGYVTGKNLPTEHCNAKKDKLKKNTLVWLTSVTEFLFSFWLRQKKRWQGDETCNRNWIWRLWLKCKVAQKDSQSLREQQQQEREIEGVKRSKALFSFAHKGQFWRQKNSLC